MKKLISSITSLFVMALILAGSVNAQYSDIQNFRYNDKRGLNVFEAPKTNTEFDGLKVRIGASNTLQLQALEHKNSGVLALDPITPNFNLATSNLDIDVQLYDGIRMHLRTYLSSQHHPEPYVKDGYMQIDKLDFISEGFMSDLMEKVTIKVGHMEVNYGDNHFRRTDNAQAFFNPFVGNYIMDSFTTEVAGEVYFKNNGFLAMAGLTNGKLNQSVKEEALKTHLSLVGKLGYDSQINEDLRVRLTGSVYHTGQSQMAYLYSGDRAGSRYYAVMDYGGNADFRAGRFDPGFTNELTAIMINPFVKFKGVEFYGVFESVSGKEISETDRRSFTQLGAELLYRFGENEDFYIGGRYNNVSGELASFGGNADVSIDRLNIGGGWFLTNNIMTKVEYVNQNYNDFPAGPFEKGNFKGFMVEAVISF